MVIKQRKTKNLGINRSKDKPKIYDYIEKELGIVEKYCDRGTSIKKSKYQIIHEGKNPLSIRSFNLLGAYIDLSGKVIIKNPPGLQAYCIECERKYRRGRLNKWYEKYSKLSDKEIYEEYKKNYGKTCHCSMCGKEKKPEEFPISKRMDRGLHNTCRECSKSYTEAVGDRWIIYSPDGHNTIKIKKSDVCEMCGFKKKKAKDHFWPISKGGTDNNENIQILCEDCNGFKSDSIIGFNSIYEIGKEMICKRYWDLLKIAKKENWDLSKFELEISKRVRDFIIFKRNMNDNELRKFFQKEKVKNNRKHSIDRAVRKFRQYCEKEIINISEYISKNR